ncbi:MAG: hypothetical protein M3153_05845 [Chloroflexota bacterium]|nr:hypothetical protein [Chloroflexota bacterium]
MRRYAPLLLLLLILALTACGGTAVSATFGEVGEEVPVESAPASDGTAPSDGTLVITGGAAVDGPGLPIADAVANAGGEPQLVSGVLLMDTDGVIWLCESLEPTSPPACGSPRLRVENFPEGTADWDLGSADITGLQEEDGVMWFENSKLFGEVQP